VTFSLAVGGHAEKEEEEKLLADLRKLIEAHRCLVAYASWDGSHTGSHILTEKMKEE
jgi:hypothetical protein